MEKIAQYLRTRAELLRTMPDLSLRTLYIIVSCCLVCSAYVLGVIQGRSSYAISELQVQGAVAFEPYDAPLLTRAEKTSGLGDSAPSAKNFVASSNGKLYYPVSCKAAARIKEENRIWFASVAEAQLTGLQPATQCGL